MTPFVCSPDPTEDGVKVEFWPRVTLGKILSDQPRVTLGIVLNLCNIFARYLEDFYYHGKILQLAK
jgi:hypothetical protein